LIRASPYFYLRWMGYNFNLHIIYFALTNF
jgi:hypothetical protein